MQNQNELAITHFIVHLVDHRAEKARLSDLETPTDAKSEFPHEFFESYIRFAWENDGSRLATFGNGVGTVSAALKALDKGGDFIAASQDIAEHLHEVMRKSQYRKQIHAGDIMVAQFTAGGDGGGDATTRLAVMKIDPSEAVIQNVKLDDEGRQQVEFRTRDSIPSPTEAGIQKIAIMSSERQPDPLPHDVVILDNNIRERGQVANFFYDDFLKSELVKTSTQATQLLVDGVRDFLNDEGDCLLATEQVALVERAHDVLEEEDREEVTLEEFAHEVVQLAGRTDEETEALRAGLIARYGRRPRAEDRIHPRQSVPTSPRISRQRRKTVTYHMDGGVRLTGDSVAVSEIVTIAPRRDAAGRTIIKIRTSNFTID